MSIKKKVKASGWYLNWTFPFLHRRPKLKGVWTIENGVDLENEYGFHLEEELVKAMVEEIKDESMSNDLEKFYYRGYYGNVHLCKEYQTFWGKVELEKDIVTYEGRSYLELETAFMDAVDDYIKTRESY